jgi:hypothetical protein
MINRINIQKYFTAVLLFCMLAIGNKVLASSHREAPLISSDPLADNVDLYAFRSPDNPDMVTLIATYVPLQLPQGGPNYYSFGENIRYEVHVDNDASKPGDEIVYRFTFNVVNEDPTTFFNIRLGKQNQKTTYTLERSIDRGVSFQTIVTNGIVPPNNIGDRSIMGGAGLNTTYAALFNSGITTATTGEKIFAGPTDDPFFVDLGGIFDLGDSPRQGGGKSVDGLACYNVSAIAIQVPISVLKKASAPAQPTNILDGDYVIGVWASASRQKVTTLSSTANPVYSGDWVQVSRLGMPLTNEAVIPIGQKDFWNSITPYDEITETTMDKYFFNPELALYMDDAQFGGAVPAFGPLRIQKKSLGAFNFSNGGDGLYGLKGNPALAGTALDDAVFGTLLLPGPGMPRSVDLWPAFHTGVPNVIPYQLATGKAGNPLAAGKPFVNNFLPNGGDMLRLNMAVPPTPRNDPNFSSLGLIQAAAIGLTVAPFNTTKDLEFIPNMDGFPNGRRLEDDVTRIELQAVGGAVLAAVGLWYDDYDPATSPSPVTKQLLNVLTYTTGVEKNDLAFTSSFPYLAQPHSATGNCSGTVIVNQPEIAVVDPGFGKNILIASRLNGGNAVPAVTTQGIGVATVTFNDDYTRATINASFANMSSEITDVHIHDGKAGTNGPVLIGLSDDLKGGRLTSTFDVTKDQVAGLINGNYYLNVHTANNVTGEIRGQLAIESAETFSATIDGAQQTPAFAGEGKGLGSFIYTANTNTLEINVLATKLTGAIKSIHLHRGAAGVAGPVVEDLTDFLKENTLNVKLNAGAYIADLRKGDIYINIHTDANPLGEIRGQITKVNGLYFDSWITAGQSAATASNGIGLAQGFVSSDLNKLSYRFITDNLSGPITNAHFHDGKLGMNGGVSIDLDGFNSFSGQQNDIAITPTTLQKYLEGGLYLNLHTSTYPSGEIRGQVYRIARQGYAYDICTKQEVTAPVDADKSSGSGMFAFNRDLDEAHMMAVASSLSGPLKSSHIHNGAVGQNGPVVFDLTDRFTNNGTFFYVTNEFTADLANVIKAGNAYVNIHTDKNPAGEIRGQFTATPECPYETAVVEVGNEKITIEAYPNPTMEVLTVTIAGDQNVVSNATITITDINGRTIKTIRSEQGANTIDVSDMTPGFYNVTWRLAKSSSTFKMVKI